MARRRNRQRRRRHRNLLEELPYSLKILRQYMDATRHLQQLYDQLIKLRQKIPNTISQARKNRQKMAKKQHVREVTERKAGFLRNSLQQESILLVSSVKEMESVVELKFSHNWLGRIEVCGGRNNAEYDAIMSLAMREEIDSTN